MKSFGCAGVLLVLACGCGGGDASNDGGDAGVDPFCEMNLSWSPQAPSIGGIVDVDGLINAVDLVGVESYFFTVSGPPQSNPDARPRAAGDDSRIEFDGDVAGIYRVELRGDVSGRTCTDAVANIFVRDPAAGTTAYRFRFVPALGQPAPAQNKTFQIPLGSEFPLELIGLDSGISTAGMVSGDAGLAAYLRFTRSFDGATTEAFADQSGDYATRLLDGLYDVLVVPQSGDRAPAMLADLSPLATVDISLPASETLSGTVLDPGGQPLQGAQVSMRIGGVPTTLAITDASGGFELEGHPGGATSIVVTPPGSSGLPRLELASSAALMVSAAAPLAIQYAAGLSSRTLSLTIVDTDGATPLPNASATLVMRPLASAGTITPQGGSAIDALGTQRLTADADDAGIISLLVPEAVYDVILRPPSAGQSGGGGPTLVRVLAADLSAGQPTPASFSATEPARLSGRVLAGAEAVEGARVSASPRGLLASEAAAAAMAMTASDGSYSLELVGGGDYDLVIVPPGSLARAVLSAVQAPAAGAQASLGDQLLPDAVLVSGQVAIPTISQPAGVTVQVFCTACSGAEAQIPLAEALSSNDGSFILSIPLPDSGGGS